MARLKIPQGVTKEDKLVGPLTLKQFLYVLGGASVLFIAYRYYSLQYLYLIEFVIISFVVGTLTIALAFAKVNGRAFVIFLATLFRFIFVPKTRSWYKEPRELLPTIKARATDIKDTKSEIEERQDNQKFQMQIEKLASILDTGGTISPSAQDAITDQITNLAQPKSKIEEAKLGVEDILEGND